MPAMAFVAIGYWRRDTAKRLDRLNISQQSVAPLFDH